MILQPHGAAQLVERGCAHLIMHHEIVRLDVPMANILAVQHPDGSHYLKPANSSFNNVELYLPCCSPCVVPGSIHSAATFSSNSMPFSLTCEAWSRTYTDLKPGCLHLCQPCLRSRRHCLVQLNSYACVEKPKGLNISQVTIFKPQSQPCQSQKGWMQYHWHNSCVADDK